MSASTESGYEAAVVTPAARLWSSALLAVLLVGCFGGAVLDNAPLQNWAMRLGTIVLLVGYVVLSRRNARASGAVLVRGLPRGAWSAIVVIGAYVVLAAAYAPLNHPLFGAHSMVSHWDQYVPTIPAFVLPYQGMYVGIVASLGFFAYRQLHRQLRTMATSFVIAMLIAESTFVLFQTEGTAARRDADSYGGFFGGMLEYVNVSYYHDDNFSTFPSMHCAYATLFAIAWYRRRRPLWSGLVIAFSMSIIVATQVLHEHVLMDALYGVVIATVAYSLAWFWTEYRPALVRERRAAPVGPTDRALPNLPSRDLVRTRDFYGGFGFGEHYRDEGWLILRRGAVQLEFFAHPGIDPSTSAFQCTVRVADLDELWDAMQAAGVPVRDVGFPRLHAPRAQDWGMRAGYLVDPDGTQLALIEEPA